MEYTFYLRNLNLTLKQKAYDETQAREIIWRDLSRNYRGILGSIKNITCIAVRSTLND